MALILCENLSLINMTTRRARTNLVLPGETIKWCSKCKTEKSLDQFHKNKSTADGLQHYCKDCAYRAYRDSYVKNKEKNSETIKRRNRNKNLKQNYGISIEFFEEMLDQQAGRCGLCLCDLTSADRAPHVDHCHITGSLRRILCHTCNVGLGMFHHDIAKLELAIAYLDSYKPESSTGEINEGWVSSL